MSVFEDVLNQIRREFLGEEPKEVQPEQLAPSIAPVRPPEPPQEAIAPPSRVTTAPEERRPFTEAAIQRVSRAMGPAIEPSRFPSVDELLAEFHEVQRRRELERQMAPPPPESMPMRLGKAFLSGALGTAEGLGGMAEYLTGGEVGKDFADLMREWRRKLQPTGEPTFAEHVASGFGSMATFFIPGMGLARGARLLANVAPWAAKLLGVTGMAVTEAATEAGLAYRDQLERTKDIQKADDTAQWVFLLNLPLLAVTDKLGYFGKQGNTIRRVLQAAGIEATQEGVQEVISQTGLGDDVKIKDVLTSAAVGGIVGGTFGALARPIERQEAPIAEREKAPTPEEKILPPEEPAPAPEKVAPPEPEAAVAVKEEVEPKVEKAEEEVALPKLPEAEAVVPEALRPLTTGTTEVTAESERALAEAEAEARKGEVHAAPEAEAVAIAKAEPIIKRAKRPESEVVAETTPLTSNVAEVTSLAMPPAKRPAAEPRPILRTTPTIATALRRPIEIAPPVAEAAPLAEKVAEEPLPVRAGAAEAAPRKAILRTGPTPQAAAMAEAMARERAKPILALRPAVERVAEEPTAPLIPPATVQQVEREAPTPEPQAVAAREREAESRPKRVRYHRGSIEDTVDAALRLKSDRPLYIYSTALGYTIQPSKPHFDQNYMVVNPDGSVYMHTYDVVKDKYTEEPVIPATPTKEEQKVSEAPEAIKPAETIVKPEDMAKGEAFAKETPAIAPEAAPPPPGIEAWPERTTPALGTEERNALENEIARIEEEIKKLDPIVDKIASEGFSKKPKIRAQQEEAQERHYELRKKHEELRKNRYQAMLEDRLEELKGTDELPYIYSILMKVVKSSDADLRARLWARLWGRLREVVDQRVGDIQPKQLRDDIVSTASQYFYDAPLDDKKSDEVIRNITKNLTDRYLNNYFNKELDKLGWLSAKEKEEFRSKVRGLDFEGVIDLLKQAEELNQTRVKEAEEASLARARKNVELLQNWQKPNTRKSWEGNVVEPSSLYFSDGHIVFLKEAITKKTYQEKLQKPRINFTQTVSDNDISRLVRKYSKNNEPLAFVGILDQDARQDLGILPQLEIGDKWSSLAVFLNKNDKKLYLLQADKLALVQEATGFDEVVGGKVDDDPIVFKRDGKFVALVAPFPFDLTGVLDAETALKNAVDKGFALPEYKPTKAIKPEAPTAKPEGLTEAEPTAQEIDNNVGYLQNWQRPNMRGVWDGNMAEVNSDFFANDYILISKDADINKKYIEKLQKPPAYLPQPISNEILKELVDKYSKNDNPLVFVGILDSNARVNLRIYPTSTPQGKLEPVAVFLDTKNNRFHLLSPKSLAFVHEAVGFDEILGGEIAKPIAFKRNGKLVALIAPYYLDITGILDADVALKNAIDKGFSLPESKPLKKGEAVPVKPSRADIQNVIGNPVDITEDLLRDIFGPHVQIYEVKNKSLFDGFQITLPNGYKILVERNADIHVPIETIKATYGIENLPSHAVIMGQYRSLETGGYIALSKLAGIPTVRHETFHAAVDLVLSEKEQRLLLDKYGDWEKAARAYSKWEPSKKPDTLFYKILDFFRRLVHKLFPNAELVFESIRSGEVWGRTEVGPGELGAELIFGANQLERYSIERLDPDERAELDAWKEDYIAPAKQDPTFWQLLRAKDWAKVKEYMKKYFQNLYDQMVDRYAPLERRELELIKQGKLSPRSIYASHAIAYMRGLPEVINADLVGENVYHHDWTYDEKLGMRIVAGEKLIPKGKALIHYLKQADEVAKALGTSRAEVIHDIFNYIMLSQRHIGLAEKRGEVPGVDPVRARRIQEIMQKKYGEHYEKLLEIAGKQKPGEQSYGIRRWEKEAILDRLYQAGFITKERYKTILNASENEYYLHMRRVHEDVNGYVEGDLGALGALKGFKGSERLIEDPFQAMIDLHRKTMYLYSRNMLRLSVAALGRLGDPDIKVEPVEKYFVKGIGYEAHKEAVQDVRKLLREMVKSGEITKEQYQELVKHPVARISELFAPQDAVPFYEDGERKWLRLPPDMQHAMKYMQHTEANLLLKIIKAPADLLRAGAILNPEFVLRNPVRDIAQAWLMNQYGFNPVLWLRDLAAIVTNKPEMRQLRGEMAAGGALVATLAESGFAPKALTEERITGKANKFKYFVSPIECLKYLSSFFENITRTSVYRQALENGASHAQAIVAARRTTLDYARMGGHPIVRLLNMSIPFWNATVQGVDKLSTEIAKTGSSDPEIRAQGMRVMRRLGMLTLFSLLAWAYASGDDRYKELEDWERIYFWHIPLYPKGPILRIPKPFEAGIFFGSVPERMAEWAMGKEAKGLRKTLMTGAEALVPEMIPAFIRPFIESWTNYNFFMKRPIEDIGLQNLPYQLRTKPWTSQAARWFAQNISPLVAPVVEISPIKMEHFVRNWTGGLGSNYILPMVDYFGKKLGLFEDIPAPERNMIDMMWGIRSFFTKEPTGYRAKSVNDYFERYAAIVQADQGWKLLWKMGKPDQLREFLNEHPEAVFAKIARKHFQEMTKIKKEREAIYNSKTISPEDKKKLLDILDERILSIAKIGNAFMDEKVAKKVRMPSFSGAKNQESYYEYATKPVYDAYMALKPRLSSLTRMSDEERVAVVASYIAKERRGMTMPEKKSKTEPILKPIMQWQ